MRRHAVRAELLSCFRVALAGSNPCCWVMFQWGHGIHRQAICNKVTTCGTARGRAGAGTRGRRLQMRTAALRHHPLHPSQPPPPLSTPHKFAGA